MKAWEEMTQKEQEEFQRQNGTDATVNEVAAFLEGVAKDPKKLESLAKVATAANPEGVLAQVAEMLGVPVEALKNMQKNSTSPGS